ncbi:MAG: ATP-binding protein [Streptomyces sp.]
MIYASEYATRGPWGMSFLAEPREVPGLRAALRMRLALWGLSDLAEAAQTCVTELTSNVITHVGIGTPATLVLSAGGAYLRIEMHDPDARALPTLLDSGFDSESGRGMALIDAVTDRRWGVSLRRDSKVVWCELVMGLVSKGGEASGPPVMGRLEVAGAEQVAIDLIGDLLHWLRARGCDPGETLDRAHMRFVAEVGTAE